MNPAILPDWLTHDQAMHICKAMLDVCDAIYLLPGWMDSKGAVEEAKHAIVHGITVWEVITKPLITRPQRGRPLCQRRHGRGRLQRDWLPEHGPRQPRFHPRKGGQDGPVVVYRAGEEPPDMNSIEAALCRISDKALVALLER